MGCVRYFLITFTLLMWVAGSVLVGLAGYVMVEDMKFKGLTGNTPMDGSILGVACFIFIIGFFGCIGATLQKRSVLKIFFILLLVFLLIQIVLVVVYIVEKPQVEALMKTNWKLVNDNTRVSIQKELNCCGMDPVEDFSSFNDTTCFTENLTRKDTCFEELAGWLNKNLIIIGSSGGCVILIEILMLVFACLHIREISRESRVIPIGKRRDDVRYPPPNGMRMPHGHTEGGQASQPRYQNRDDVHLEDVYDENYPIEHSRGEWARNSYRQEWHNKKKKR